MARNTNSIYNAHVGLQNPPRIDALDTRIIDELMSNADISSTELSKKFRVPLSTIQRRRARIEGAVLAKKYSLRPMLRNHRIAKILITAKNGKTDEVAKAVYDKFPAISEATVGINTAINITATLYFKDTEDLHDTMQEIAAMSFVGSVQFYEIVKIIGEREISLEWYKANRD
jgi:DNA-binding Lrp family transcriptional regulator